MASIPHWLCTPTPCYTPTFCYSCAVKLLGFLNQVTAEESQLKSYRRPVGGASLPLLARPLPDRGEPGAVIALGLSSEAAKGGMGRFVLGKFMFSESVP
jgi:hypothetical protein